ncbi:ribonuclease Z [Candidatus Aerophobetes bacterium]|nr:ribonuclease Z [Candidatus Aerophobetes bacterium]
MGKIELTLLGTSAGVPTQKRSHPCIYLSYTGEKKFCFLFDCGEGTQRQIFFTHLNFMKISEIFITHWHGDHYLGLPGLIETMRFENRTKPLTIYSPEPARVKKLLSSGYPSHSFKIIHKFVPVSGQKITALLETDDFRIASIPVKHTVPCVAYALIEKDRLRIDKKKLKDAGLPIQGIMYGELKRKGKVFFKGKEITYKDICSVHKGKKVVYSGDTKICDNLIKIADKADLLIQDCTYFDEDDFEDYGHASFSDVLALSKSTRIKRIILTHISRRYKSAEELQEKIKNNPCMEIAKDFMKVTV